MSEINISLVQKDDVVYTARQGNQLVIDIIWEQEAEGSTPKVPVYELIDISDMTFFAQLRKDTADKNNTVVHEFEETPDDDDNYFDVDIEEARVTYYLSDELMRSIKTKGTESYFLESKMRDAGGNNIESVVVIIKTVPEYSREAPEPEEE